MASKGRVGRPYRRLRRTVQARPDGWTCIRCGHPINPGWPPRHPNSWSLDHLIPLDDGGSLLDPNNCGPAHLACNSRHGQSLQHRPTQSRAW